MTSTLVIDTSVAIKWMVPEEGSDAAARLRQFALILRENAPLVTEDRRLLQLARQHERFRSLVLSLDDANRIRP